MRKHFLRVYSGILTQLLHLPPDIAPIKGLPGSSNKQRTGRYIPFFSVLPQSPAQRFRQKYLPLLSFAPYLSPSPFYGLNCNIRQLGNTDSCSPERLKEHFHPPVPFPARFPQQFFIFFFGQLALLPFIDFFLNSEKADAELLSVHPGKEVIQRGQHGIDAPGPVVLAQIFFPAENALLARKRITGKLAERFHIAEIFLDCVRTFLFFVKSGDILRQVCLGDFIRHKKASVSIMIIVYHYSMGSLFKNYNLIPPDSFCLSVTSLSSRVLAGSRLLPGVLQSGSCALFQKPLS